MDNGSDGGGGGPQDEERDGQLLWVDLGVMCECGTEIRGRLEIDIKAPDFEAAILPTSDLVCPTCTTDKGAEFVAAGARALIPFHVAVGQHHRELIGDDDLPEGEQLEQDPGNG